MLRCAPQPKAVQHLVASVASQGRFPVATGLSLCLYLNCATGRGESVPTGIGSPAPFGPAGEKGSAASEAGAALRGSTQLVALQKNGRWKGEGRAPSPFHSGVFTRLSGQGERGLKRPGQSNQANIGDLTTDFPEPITGQSKRASPSFPHEVSSPEPPRLINADRHR